MTVAGDDRSRGSGVRSEHTSTQSRRCGVGRRRLSGGRGRGDGRPRPASAPAQHRRRRGSDLVVHPGDVERHHAAQARQSPSGQHSEARPERALVDAAAGSGHRCRDRRPRACWALPHTPADQQHQIGGFSRRTTQIDKTERDTIRYCYAVFTLDAAGNWDTPVTRSCPEPGRHAAARAGDRGQRFGRKVRCDQPRVDEPCGRRTRRGGTRPQLGLPAAPGGWSSGGHAAAAEAQLDTAVQSAPGTYCYAVFAFDKAGNRPRATATVTVTPPRRRRPRSRVQRLRISRDPRARRSPTSSRSSAAARSCSLVSPS